jgi:hypothetical protein
VDKLCSAVRFSASPETYSLVRFAPPGPATCLFGTPHGAEAAILSTRLVRKGQTAGLRLPISSKGQSRARLNGILVLKNQTDQILSGYTFHNDLQSEEGRNEPWKIVNVQMIRICAI